MRWPWWVIVLCAAATGCLTQGNRPAGVSVARSLAPAPMEGIYLETVLLERPLGDSFLDRELWDVSLPVGSPETRVLLTENGMRAAVLAGNPPQKFQTMLESESEAISSRGLTFATRKEEVLPTSGPHASCEFGFLADLAGKRIPVKLEQARCGIQVRPEGASGRVKITCEPQIQFGKRRDLFRPSEDHTGWVKIEEVPLARYSSLTFETTLGRNEFLLVGWRADQPNTLGETLFSVSADGRPRQRVLVIRARLPNDTPSELPLIGTRRPSIAAEAGRRLR